MRQIGDLAPDFELPSQTGERIRLSSFRGRNVVLFFYPKDDTPICTKETCSFRDEYEEFQKAESVVLGVSSDGIDSHRSFASKHSLQFPLLSDEGSQVRKLYGIPKTAGLMPGRATFVIDKEGVIRGSFVSQFRAAEHVRRALEVLNGQRPSLV